MTLEEMTNSPQIQFEAAAFFDAALRMPRPECYANRSDDEWEAIVKTAVEDLMILARCDGCVAAAWALSMIKHACEKR